MGPSDELRFTEPSGLRFVSCLNGSISAYGLPECPKKVRTYKKKEAKTYAGRELRSCLQNNQHGRNQGCRNSGPSSHQGIADATKKIFENTGERGMLEFTTLQELEI